ncbi:helicase-exonuclease AddAB subunit AddA [Cellulosilyticum sp. I15G10I2]|uniref:helicase-exonuclease AddAB subunit AddA n=1 Tax=Cellulosilyticum sp. I15G10I2 TaxID=1892843 RepID=UPI00085C3CC3|nr:helicase-exonuclease AddAB subunit AddA [Cellulosilyticum sp. I15G10I2]
MAWTKPQQAAIDKRNADILVSAAAGSGKTAVLTERVINRIAGSSAEEPIQLDRFLIVTFTSAAANEMKERITSKLSDKIDAMQDELLQENTQVAAETIAYLERQIALVQTASISTIHSFCLKIIKTYFHKLDIDPNIKVASEAELGIMKMDILQEMIEEKFEQEDEDFLKIAEIYGSVQGMSPLANLILDIYTFSKSTPFPQVWMDEKVRLLSAKYHTLEQMPWSAPIKQYILCQIKDIRILYEEAIVLCKKASGPELYLGVIEEDRRRLMTINETQSLDEIVKEVQAITFASLPRKKQECDELLKERVKDYRNLAKDIIRGIQEDLLFISDDKVLNHLPQVGSLMKILIELIKMFEVRYQEAKQNAGIVDYSDLEHLCMKVLVTPHFSTAGEFEGITYTDAAKELNQFYKEIYIDEYQDSNMVQEMILNAIAEASGINGPSRFMVGDMKQSIYRFRLANPLIFANKYETWEKYLLEGGSDARQVCIDLSQNFRSRANILNGINELFEQLMSKEVGDLEYDDYAKLKVGNHYQADNIEDTNHIMPANQIELHILETKESEGQGSALSDDNELEDLKSVELEALMTASLIDKLLKGESNPTHLFDNETKSYRKIEPRDIVILLRATKNKASIYENALLSKGIGAYADVNSSFFEAIEIQVMLSMLKIIDNPFQDIPLITILRSPIVGISLDDLVVIRQSSDVGCFYEALRVYCQKEEAKDSIQAFMKKLSAYRMQCSQFSIEELIARIYVETGYYRYVTMLATGAKKKANLEMFRKYASEFESSHNGKLFNFIQYLDRLQETSDAIGEAKLVGDNENLVRIMSIHKSKGLEFGIVFLCDTAKKFNNNDIVKNVLLHNELGLAPDFIDTSQHIRYPTIPKIAVKNQITSENISEEMRVFYVALTRAKEKLFITGTLSDFKQKAKNWSLFGVRGKKEILSLGVKRAGSYLNWIGLSLFAHANFADIRDAAGTELNYTLEGDSRWILALWHKMDLIMEHKQSASISEDKKRIISEWDTAKTYGPYKEEIYKRLSFEYPHKNAIVLPIKMSVSEIKNKSDQKRTIIPLTHQKDDKRIPAFINEVQQIKGARRGTLIHSVFEHLDFLTAQTEEAIKEALDQLICEHKIQEETLQVIDLKRLVQFAESDMVRRMKKAKHVWKEKQFIYLAQAKTIDLSYPEDEDILIQGVIDTLFLEDDGIVIIDYKTDYIDYENMTENIAYTIDKYKTQLELYTQAIEEITKLPVKEKSIYLYHINRWIQV